MSMNVFQNSLSALTHASQFTNVWQDSKDKQHEFDELEIVCKIQDEVIKMVGTRQGIYLADDKGNIYIVSGDGSAPEMLFEAKNQVHKTKYCRNCGAVLKDGWKFCGECGQKL